MNSERESAPLTLGEARRQGAEHLRQAGVEEADADAELLLLYVLGIGKSTLLRDWRDPFPAEKRETWDKLLERRGTGIPVQYVIGEQHFFGRPFEVSEAVLIPRPETELLAEAVLDIATRLWPDPAVPPVVLDVGTGSGALAVTFAAERPEWRVFASDLSEDALRVAGRNAVRHGVEERITFVQGDLLSPFMASAGNEYPQIDILVSNPPYIPSSDIPELQREVRDHEPRLALDGGEDGLNPYRIMAGQLKGLIGIPRVVAMEVGIHQAEEVAEFLRAAADWAEIRYVKDYAGIDRHVVAIK
ncbi:peptide chain release factor N(5)-glutamine methyltransferase [Cohnella endophytica]|uniref:Release factor glutamine methyltransferase n=1 Tax=Cohnella endophytica TaxID=2419778 RepID=A0A494XIE5_9BACL|nr:peptide chain release factor N(5)-glutamine methyltransferase [Cohnella endophytica]RKP47323.1 peptide chain release factor N(5)-glutamine methyltransferase [Cohnella endophytica]